MYEVAQQQSREHENNFIGNYERIFPLEEEVLRQFNEPYEEFIQFAECKYQQWHGTS